MTTEISPDGQPPFRADHVGSLLRPAGLRRAFRSNASGELSDTELLKIQDDAIRDVVALQEACGLAVVTDGEFRRISYWEKFVRLTEGLEVRGADFSFHDDAGRESEFTAPYAAGKLRRQAPIALDEVRYLQGLTGAVAKVTLPAPSTMHFYRFTDYAAQGLYACVEDYFSDLARVYQEEIAELAAAGTQYIQFDEVALAMLCDPCARERVTAAGQDPEQLVDLYVNAINQALEDAPEGVVFAVHMCRGNYKGMYLSAGGYDSVADKLFGQAAVNHFLLEFDTPRAGDFSPLRFVPGDKGVVLGLVCSKRTELEPVDHLVSRVEAASAFVDGERLAISPQCGFARPIGGNPVDESHQRAKLGLCVAAAEKIWG